VLISYHLGKNGCCHRRKKPGDNKVILLLITTKILREAIVEICITDEPIFVHLLSYLSLDSEIEFFE